MKYGTWTLGHVEALLNRLGEDNARKLLDCREVTVTFDTGTKCATITADAPALKVWKTIKIGTGIKFDKEILSTLEQHDSGIDDWIRNMLARKLFTFATQEEEVDLVRLSVAELGFKEGARYDAICARAIEMGLELCPAEVGPQLRLQYPDQPRGERFLIAMEAIRDLDHITIIFGVGHCDDGRYINGPIGCPSCFWGPGVQFLFRLPRKQPLEY